MICFQGFYRESRFRWAAQILVRRHTLKRLLYGDVKFAQILLALAILFVGLASAAPKPAQFSRTDRDNLRNVVVNLKEAIIHEDVDGILRHVSKSNGLTCRDTQIPYQQVRKDIHDRNSHLYMSLFDSVGFFKKCGYEYPAEYLAEHPAISDKEFLSTATNESIEIVAITDEWAQVTFKSQTKAPYRREYSFHKEGRGWKLTGGLIVSRCSCR